MKVNREQNLQILQTVGVLVVAFGMIERRFRRHDHIVIIIGYDHTEQTWIVVDVI